MTFSSRWTLLLALALAVLPSSLRAQGTGQLELTVLDSTGTPIADASVEVAGVGLRSLTDSRGVARVRSIPVGSRVVVASRIGFGSARVALDFTAGQLATATVTLNPSAVALEGISGTGGRINRTLSERGFYERQRRGMGAYMTADQIDLLRPLRTVDLMRRMRGFAVGMDQRGKLVVQTRRGSSSLNDCGPPLIYLDGVQVPARVSDREDMLLFIPPETIAGIEAYAGAASIPPQYNPTGAACGAILFWTRTGPD